MTNNVNYGIFLDDERIPEDVYWVQIKHNKVQYTVVRNFEDFKNEVKKMYNSGIPIQNMYLSFDHDLALYNEDGTEIKGYHMVVWLIDYIQDEKLEVPPVENIFYHSRNPIGEENMHCYIEDYRKHHCN